MIQATALKMVFDILLLHGTEIFRSDDDDDDGAHDDDDTVREGNDDTVQEETDDLMADFIFSDEADGKRRDGDEATHKLLKILIDFLDHEVHTCSEMIHNDSLLLTQSVTMREIAGEGLIKLLYSGRVLNQRILARLLLLWFNPVMEDSSILRSLLGTFFPIFASVER